MLVAVFGWWKEGLGGGKSEGKEAEKGNGECRGEGVDR